MYSKPRGNVNTIYRIQILLQMKIQITLITTSKLLSSPASYLKLHIPSVFSFQYAPVALCIPLLPMRGSPSMLVTSVLTSLNGVVASLVFEDVLVVIALGLLSAEVGTRCWMMVLLTAYLYRGFPPPGGDDSEIKERSMELMIVVFHCSVLECS